MLTRQDNPYADWGLLSFSAALASTHRAIDEVVRARKQEMEAWSKRGLNLPVQVSRQPAETDIEFRSPYGYAIVGLVPSFDYLVPLVKTLVRKDRLPEDEGREQIAMIRPNARPHSRSPSGLNAS